MKRSPSGRFYNWEEIVAEARRSPGAWAVKLANQPSRLVRTVRDRAHKKLRLEDGVIEIRMRNWYTDHRGVRRGDAWLRYLPNGGQTPPRTGV